MPRNTSTNTTGSWWKQKTQRSAPKKLHQHKSKHIAAIASKLAADLFELEVIAPNIHTMKSNYTRFLVIQREDIAENVADANKASVNFNTDHSRGSLARVLTRIADGGINLSKLQSFPIPEATGSTAFTQIWNSIPCNSSETVIEQIKPITTELKVYGVYKKGKAIV